MSSTKRSFPLSLRNGSGCGPTRSTFLQAAALIAAIGVSGCAVSADDNEEMTDNEEEGSREEEVTSGNGQNGVPDAVPNLRPSKGIMKAQSLVSNWYADWGLVGGSGGAYRSTPNWNAGPIKTIEVWAGGSQLRGIKITHWTGAQYQFGTLTDQYSSFTFQTGEKVTALSLWGNGAGTRSGGFKIKTDKGREFFPHMYSWGLKTEYPMPVGSGFLVGMGCNSGVDIDSLGFVLVNDVNRVAVTSMNYGGKAAGENAGQGQAIQLGNVSYNNRKSTGVGSYTLSAQKTVTASNSFTNSFGISVGAEFGFEGGVPLVASTSATFSLTTSYQFSSTHDSSTSIGNGWSVTQACPPKRMCYGTATVTTWTKDLPYSGTMKYILKNGSTYTHPINGNYHGVLNSKLTSKFWDTP